MTNEQLSGRDLDEACALALGWTSNRFDGFPPAYSSDPATLDEKLVWIQTHDEQFERLEILEYRDEVIAHFWDAYGWNRLGRGKDIHEATARLVVALAKEKQK